MVPLLVEIQKRVGPCSIDAFCGLYYLYRREGRREVDTGIIYNFDRTQFKYRGVWYTVDEFRKYLKMWVFS